MQQDAHNPIKLTSIAVPISITASWSSAVFDATNELSVAFFVHYGAGGISLTGTRLFTCKLQHATTSAGSYSDFVAADYIIGPDDTAAATFGIANSEATDSAMYSIGISDNQVDRFFKMICTLTGTNSSGIPTSAGVVSIPKITPAGNVITP